MQEPKPDLPIGVPADADREPGLAPAALGFPLVLLTLIAHGAGVFLVRQGLWLPGPAVDLAWTVALAIGVGGGLAISAIGGRGAR